MSTVEKCKQCGRPKADCCQRDPHNCRAIGLERKLRQRDALIGECFAALDQCARLLRRVATPDQASGHQYLDLNAKDAAWKWLKSKKLAALKARFAEMQR